MFRWLPKNNWLIYALLLLLSCVARAPFWNVYDFVSYDGVSYINQARHFWSTGPMHGAFPIGYPFFVSLLVPLVPDDVLAAQLVSFVFGAALLALTFQLALRFVSRQYAFLAAAGLALAPLFVRTSFSTFSEITYACFVVLSLLLLTARRDTWAGAAAGVAAITRPEVLAIVAFVSVFRFRRPGRLLAFLIPFVAIFAINSTVFYVRTGNVVLLPKKESFARGTQLWQDRELTAERAEELGLAAEGSMADWSPDPLKVATWYAQKLPFEVFTLGRLVGFIALVLAVYGMFRRRTVLIVAMVPFVVAPLFTVVTTTRFLLPYLPFVFVYAAIGLEALPAQRREYGLWALLAGIGINFVVSGSEIKRPVNERPLDVKDAGLYLRDYVNSGDRIADRKPFLAFYAGAERISYPADSYEATMDYLLENNARFLSLRQASVQALRPMMMPLMVDSAMVAGELRYEQVFGYDTGLLVYQRVVDRNPITWRRVTFPERGLDSTPAWSPDGKSLAFTSTRSGNLDIYVASADTTGPAQLLVGGDSHEDEPEFSPDGKYLVFSGVQNENWEIFLLEFDSGEIFPITNNPAHDFAPVFTRDSERVIFASDREGTTQLWEVGVNGRGLRRITDGNDKSYPAISPDGTKLAWVENDGEMRWLDARSGQITRVSRPRSSNFSPTFSPDGNYIAITGRDWGSVDVYIARADGKRHLLLTRNAMINQSQEWFDGFPAWSPDGTRIAVASNKDGVRSIYVIEGVGASLHRLKDEFPIRVFNPPQPTAH